MGVEEASKEKVSAEAAKERMPAEKVEQIKTKSKQKKKQEEKEEEKILTATLAELKKLTLPDVNVERPKSKTTQRTMQKHTAENISQEDNAAGKDLQSNRGRGGNNRGKSRQRRGSDRASTETAGYANEDEEEDNESDTESKSSSFSNPNRRRGNRRGRGAFHPSGSSTNLSLRNDSDNESICSETSQSGRSGRGGRNQRGDRGRGRGGRGAISEKSFHRSQEEIDGEKKSQHDNTEFADDADNSFSEAKMFRYLVTTLGGCVHLSKFKENFSPLPENFDEWIRGPKNRLSVFKSGDKPLAVGPFLRDATVCADHMGFGGKKNCHRKDCNHFHICNFYLNGWCKRGRNCGKGHTFTKGHNREVKAKLGLNPFKDAEIKTIILCRYPQVCPKAKCRKEDCPYLHICFNFLRDKCNDSECPKGHDLKTTHNLWVLSVFRMQKWVEDRLALLKFLINKPRKPKTKETSGVDNASRVDETESVGTVDDEDFEENLDDDDDDNYDDSEDNDDDESDENEEMTQDVYHNPLLDQKADALPLEESVPRKRLDRRHRWTPDTEGGEITGQYPHCFLISKVHVLISFVLININ